MGPRLRRSPRGLVAAAVALLAAGCGGPRVAPLGLPPSPPPVPPTPALVAAADAAVDPHPAPAAVAVAVEPPPSRPPRPVSGELPALTLENLRFADTWECERSATPYEVFNLAPARPDEVARTDGATTLPPALGYVYLVHPGAVLHLQRRADIDRLGVVLAGRAALRPDERRAAVATAPAWTAFYLPEGGMQVRAAGPAPVALFIVGAAEHPGAGVGDAVAGVDPQAPRPRGSLVLRPLAAVPDLAWGGGAYHARIAFEAPASPWASLGVLIAGDDAPVAEHEHPGAWEMLAAVSAAGRLHIPAQAVPGTSPGAAVEAHDRTVTGGTIAYVPAGVRHGWIADGTHPLIAVQVYSPPGPEQRFRTLGGVTPGPDAGAAPR